MNDFELSRFFLAIVLLLGGAHSLGFIFLRLRLPPVVGWIVWGFVLGPSLLGLLLPEVHRWIFVAFSEEGKLLSSLSWIGLVLLVFTSGFRLRQETSWQDVRLVLVLLLATTPLPFFLGWLAVPVFGLDAYRPAGADPIAFRLIVAISVSVTSIPVISKIFADLRILDTPFARIVLTTSVFHDLLLWMVLTMATGMAAASMSGATSTFAGENAGIAATDMAKLMRIGGTTILFLAAGYWLGPLLLRFLGGLKINFVVKSSRMGYLLLLCFAFAALTSLLEVNLVFGALVAGMAVGTLPDKPFRDVRDDLSGVANAFFIPLYFAMVGLKLNLPAHFSPELTIGFLLGSSFVVCGCVMVATRLAGCDGASSINFAFAMNTRGGPGIVLATVAYEYGLITGEFFVALVVAAVLTSLLSGAWFRRVVEAGRPLFR